MRSSLGTRPAIGTVVIVILLVVIVAGAGGTAYYVLVVSSTAGSTTSNRISTTSSFSTRSTTGPSGVITFSGSYNFSLSLGPVGELVNSSNTVKNFDSVQMASGTFTFWINPSNYSGGGSGQGLLTVTTRGFCSGLTIVPYSFKILDATHFPGQNFTVYVGTPTPANFTVPLTCTATPTQGSTNGNTFAYISTYPNEFVFAAAPVTVSQHLSGNTTYWYTIHSP